MIQKEELIHRIASKCGYTLEDTNNFFAAFVDVFRDSIINREDIAVRGFGKLKFSMTKAHEGNKPTKGQKGVKEKIWIPDTETVRFTLATDLRSLMKDSEEEF